MAGDLTSANAVIMIAVPGIFPVSQQLQYFAADDVFDTDSIEASERVMGVDGHLAGGFVFVPIVQTYALQADSPSINLFDLWWATQVQTKSLFRALGHVQLPAIGKKWALTGGLLGAYKPFPDVKRRLMEQRFSITWESSIPSPI